MMFPNLVNIWNCAQKAIEGADVIVAVGYSFSEADSYITKMISRSLASKAEQQLIVVDTNMGLAPLLRSRLAAHIDGFNEARVLRAGKSCELVLPDVLESMLGRRKEVAAANGAAGEPTGTAAVTSVTS